MGMLKVLLTCLLFLYGAAGAQDSTIQQAFKQSETWLSFDSSCPADKMPDFPIIDDYDKTLCEDDLINCLKKCKNNSVHFCYNLAQHIQVSKLNKYEKHAEALFIKSCALGSPSGCTNSASTMQSRHGESILSCAIKTYSKACDWDDPWACTMFGFHLTHGKGVQQDLNKALKVLSKSCSGGLDDPACSNATALINKIKNSTLN